MPNNLFLSKFGKSHDSKMYTLFTIRERKMPQKLWKDRKFVPTKKCEKIVGFVGTHKK